MTDPALNEQSDEALACGARAGSMASFEELVRRYQVPLLRFLQRRGPRPSEAEDVLQDTFLKAFKSLGQYREQFRFKTWLFTIAYRLAVSAMRADHRTGSIVDSSLPVDMNGPDARSIRRETHEAVWDLARRVLTEEQCAVLWLHYVEETSPRDIAVVTGRSWVWVRTALHRSRKKMEVAIRNTDLQTTLVGSDV